MTPQQGRLLPRGRLRTVVLFIGALLFLFEEWLWTGLTRLFAWLARLGLLRWLDARLVRLAPVMALVILCIPILLLFPFKVAGLWMIATGHFFTGCLVMLAAKVTSTAVIARIFLTCRSQLLQMPWFARLHAWTCILRDRVHLWIGQQPAWHDARSFVRHVKSHVRAWMRGTSRRRAEASGPARRGALRRWRSRRKAKHSSAAAANLANARRADGEGR